MASAIPPFLFFIYAGCSPLFILRSKVITFLKTHDYELLTTNY